MMPANSRSGLLNWELIHEPTLSRYRVVDENHHNVISDFYRGNGGHDFVKSKLALISAAPAMLEAGENLHDAVWSYFDGKMPQKIVDALAAWVVAKDKAEPVKKIHFNDHGQDFSGN